MLASASAAVALYSYAPAILTNKGEIVGNNSTVVLKPEDWLDKQFPLLKHIDIGAQLAVGQWIVVLYRPDCPRCREELARLERRAREEAWSAITTPVALINVSKGNAEKESVGEENSWCLRGRLSSSREWFFRPPVILRIHDGRVVAVERSVGRYPPP